MSAPVPAPAEALERLRAMNRAKVTEIGGLETLDGRQVQLAAYIQEWMFSEAISGTNPLDIVNAILFIFTGGMVEAALNLSVATGDQKEAIFEQFEDFVHHTGRDMLANTSFDTVNIQ